MFRLPYLRSGVYCRPDRDHTKSVLIGVWRRVEFTLITIPSIYHHGQY